MSGTAIEVVAVVEVDGRTIGEGRVGPIARRLIEAYAAHVGSHGPPIRRNDNAGMTQAERAPPGRCRSRDTEG